MGEPVGPITKASRCRQSSRVKTTEMIGYGNYAGRSVIDETPALGLQPARLRAVQHRDDGVPIVPHVHGGHTDFQFDGNPEFFFSPGWDDPRAAVGRQEVPLRQRASRRARSGTTTTRSASRGSTSTPGWRASTSSATTSTPGCPAIRSACRPSRTKRRSPFRTRCSRTTASSSIRRSPATRSTRTSSPAKGPSCRRTSSRAAARPGWPSSSATTWWSTARSGRRWTSSRATTGCASSTAATAASWPCSSSRCRRRDRFRERRGPLPFTVIGSDQGLASSPTTVDTLLMETGSRYDVIFDFKTVRRATASS